MKTTIEHNELKILITEGPSTDMIRIPGREIYKSHLWIHNNLVKKNHTKTFDFEINEEINNEDLMKSLKTVSKFNL